MSGGPSEVLFHREEGNPILTAADWPYPINTVFNAGATTLPDGSTLLLCRVENRTGISHLCAARSPNGVDDWEIDPQPTLLPDPANYPEETWGIEDPRITFIPALNKYAVVFTSYSLAGPSVSLALTEDFRSFERYGEIQPPEDKDAALLPRQLAGKWVLIHRPESPLGAHIWISHSPDLHHWGGSKRIIEARRGAWVERHSLRCGSWWVRCSCCTTSLASRNRSARVSVGYSWIPFAQTSARLSVVAKSAAI